MILHIPHASTNTLTYTIEDKERELLRMTDHFTDELYTYTQATRLIFGVSRLICDVERFEDDTHEYMSKFGMGVCYTTNTEGEKLRDVSEDDKEYILENFYRPHHKSLSDAVDKELEEKGSALIVDCHSFPDKPYYFNSDFGEKRPDICIGTNSFHTDISLIHTVKKFFLFKGYHVRVDNPYSGTIVPLKHYKKNKNVTSIMIEINRKLYMDSRGTKTEHFETLKDELNNLLSRLENTNL